jgi:SNF2 family DNA or RNA helicase
LKYPPLFTHQVESVAFFARSPKALDFSDPGTGKTRVQIEDFAIRRTKGGGKALVLGPKSLLKSAWEDDIKRYAPQLKTTIAYASNRAKAFAVEADVYLTNIDAAKWLAQQPAKFFKDFDTLIIDECTAFKHHTSQRSKAINKIKKYFAYRRGLTGTPSSNGMLDLWHQAYIIDDGARLGKSFFGYRNSICAPQQVGPQPNHIRWQDKEGAEEVVYGLLKDVVIRHKFEECTDVPENHQYSMSFHMNPMHRKRYETLQRDAMIVVGKEVVNAVHAAALVTKLLQTASGAVYAESGNYALIDSDRTQMVLDLVEERPHSVVFFNWQHQRDLLVKEAQKRGITFAVLDGETKDKQRGQIVTEYQAGYYKVLFAHPQSAAHGLTLTRGTTTIWCSPTYNLEHFLQGNKRIYRAGQKQKTETIVLVAPGTIEEQVWERLQAKDLKQGALLELLKTPIVREAA